MKKIVIAAIVSLTFATTAHSQSESAPQGPAPAIAFSVATIKPSNPGAQGWRANFTVDGYSALNAPLRTVIKEAYGVYEDERLIGSDPIEADKFDIEARIDEVPGLDPRNLSLDQRRSMLQALLADRFKLSVHHESKELPVFALVIAKNGPKLKKEASEAINYGGIKGYDGLVAHTGPGYIDVKSFTMSNLALDLHYWAGRLVVDKTGLPGRYDFTLRWNLASGSAEPQPYESSAPSIFVALEQQLGLKLEPMKYPVDTIVVDHVELPSAN